MNHPKPARPPQPAIVLSALAAVQVLFGLNYVFSKIIVTELPPLIWADIRIASSAVLMTAVAFATSSARPKLDGKFLRGIFACSIAGIVVNQGAFLLGLKRTTSTNSAVLNTLIPVFTLLFVTIRGKESLTLTRVFGFAVAFTGVLAIRRIEDFTWSNETAVGDALTVLGCLSFSVFLAFSRDFLNRYDRTWATAWLFIAASVSFTAAAIPDWLSFHAPSFSWTLAGSMVFAIIGGTVITYFLNLWALAYAQSSSVALFIYLQPVVASLFAWAWLGQQITLRTTLSCLLIFGGMLLALLQNLRAERPPGPDLSHS